MQRGVNLSRPKTESRLLQSGAPFPIAVIADGTLRGRIHEWGGGPDEIRSVGLSYPRLDCEVYTYGYVLWGGPVPTWRDLPEMLLSKLAFASGAVRRAMGPRTSEGANAEDEPPPPIPGPDLDKALGAVMERFRPLIRSEGVAVPVDGVAANGLRVWTEGFWMTGLGHETAKDELTIVLTGRGHPKDIALQLVDSLRDYIEPR